MTNNAIGMRLYSLFFGKLVGRDTHNNAYYVFRLPFFSNFCKQCPAKSAKASVAKSLVSSHESDSAAKADKTDKSCWGKSWWNKKRYSLSNERGNEMSAEMSGDPSAEISAEKGKAVTLCSIKQSKYPKRWVIYSPDFDFSRPAYGRWMLWLYYQIDEPPLEDMLDRSLIYSSFYDKSKAREHGSGHGKNVPNPTSYTPPKYKISHYEERYQIWSD